MVNAKKISELRSLGPKSQEMLAKAGITSIEHLTELGSVEAYVRAKEKSPAASLNLLWGLESALSGEPWQEVARVHRASLLLALEQRRKKMPDPLFQRIADSAFVEVADPESSEAQQLLANLSESLRLITGSSGAASFDASDVKVEGACFVIARSADGVALGCGALRPLGAGVAELKRMYAVPGSKGVGSSVLSFLERKAGEFGYGQVWLETRRVNEKAVAFYERHGYRPIAGFGRYVGKPEAICFGKHLTGEIADLLV